MTNPKDSGAWTEVGPHNTIVTEKIALEKELKEVMAAARRKKLTCFQKTRTRVVKKTAPIVTTTATTATTSMVTPKMTPEELVKFMDVAVASKYSNNLSNFTRVIIDDVRSTLESFKTDLQNTLPRQN
jgi:hypothetical protein